MHSAGSLGNVVHAILITFVLIILDHKLCLWGHKFDVHSGDQLVDKFIFLSTLLYDIQKLEILLQNSLEDMFGYG